jgi:hypothetical protein
MALDHTDTGVPSQNGVIIAGWMNAMILQRSDHL